MQIDFKDLKNVCKYLEEDNEDEWCDNKLNDKHNLYCSCNEKLCPLKREDD